MNGLSKISLRATLLGATMLCVAGPASASFLGDTIGWETSGTGISTINETGSLTPNPTDSDLEGLGSGGEFFSISANATDSSFEFVLGSSNNNLVIDISGLMLELTDIDWMPSGVITGVNDLGGSGELDSANHIFSTTSDSVTLTYLEDVSIPLASVSSIQFQIVVDETPSVPEPGSLVGLLTGLAGLGALRRRRRRNA